MKDEKEGGKSYCRACGKNLSSGRRGVWKYYCNKKCFEQNGGKYFRKYKRRTKEIKPEMKKQLMVALLDNNKKTKTDISVDVWKKKLVQEGEKKPDDELTTEEKKRATAYMSRLFAELEKDGLIIAEQGTKNGQDVHYVQFNSEARRQISKYFLDLNVEAASEFIASKFGQWVIDKEVDNFENRTDIVFSDKKAAFIKWILPLSPTAMKRFLFSDFDSIMQVTELIENIERASSIEIDIGKEEEIDFQKFIELIATAPTQPNKTYQQLEPLPLNIEVRQSNTIKKITERRDEIKSGFEEGKTTSQIAQELEIGEKYVNEVREAKELKFDQPNETYQIKEIDEGEKGVSYKSSANLKQFFVSENDRITAGSFPAMPVLGGISAYLVYLIRHAVDRVEKAILTLLWAGLILDAANPQISDKIAERIQDAQITD